MGGEHDRLTAAEAASVLGWWIEAGVDVAIQEGPRTWLSEAPAAAPAAGVRPVPVSTQIQELPVSFEAFRSWLEKGAVIPLENPAGRLVLPFGIEAAEVMLLADAPSAEEAAEGRPIAGRAWELTQRMLAAIGLTAEQAYIANLSCVHNPGARLSPKEVDACAVIVRRQISLARPRRLLLLGDGPCKALLGKSLAAARGHVHKIEGVRAVATFHPRFLLDRPSNKHLAWRDLLLLMEEEV